MSATSYERLTFATIATASRAASTALLHCYERTLRYPRRALIYIYELLSHCCSTGAKTPWFEAFKTPLGRIMGSLRSQSDVTQHLMRISPWNIIYLVGPSGQK